METETSTETAPPTEPGTEGEEVVYRCATHGIVEPVEIADGKLVCPECRKFVSREAPPTPLKPPDVEMTEAVVEALGRKLPSVYGISKDKARAIIDTVRGNPAIALSPMNLFVHIKQLERRANDYHLWITINSIFEELRTSGWTGMPLPPFQTLQQQSTQQYPPMPGYGAQGYQFGYGYQPLGYPPGRPPTPMKVVVEGQEVETDMPGYMAWRRWESDKKRDEQDAREHELRMKKLEAEVKEIESRAAGAGGGEEKVEVEVEGQKFTVPASLAPAYLALRKPKESEEVKGLRQEVKDLTEKIHSKEMEGLSGQIQALGGKIEKLEGRPSLMEELDSFDRAATRMGYKKSGRTAIDVLEGLTERVDERAKQILQKMPPAPGEELRPEVIRGPTEREEKAREIEERLEKGKELLDAEDSLVRAASKLK